MAVLETAVLADIINDVSLVTISQITTLAEQKAMHYPYIEFVCLYIIKVAARSNILVSN